MGRTLIGASIGAVAIAASLGMAVGPTVAAGAAQPAATAGTATTGPGGVPATVTRPWLEQALARRQTTLSRLTSAVEKSPDLSTAVRRTLESQLAAETSGIDALAASAPHEPTATLAATAATMVHQYRVYLVMVPKGRIAVAAGRQQRAEQRGTRLESVVSARIAAAQQAGRTVAQAQAADQDLVRQIAQATADTSHTAAVLAVQPSGYPADAGTIDAARADLEAARAVLPAVRTDLRTIRSALGA